MHKFWTVVQQQSFKIYAVFLMVILFLNVTQQYHSSAKFIFIFQFDGIIGEMLQLGM